MAELVRDYEDNLQSYKNDPAAASQLLATGAAPADQKDEIARVAAWTMVANLLLNLDEVLNK